MKLYMLKCMDCDHLCCGKVRVYTRRSPAPHHQGQKSGKKEKDMYGPLEVNVSMRLGSAGHCTLPVYIMDKILVTWWKPMAVETICKKGKEVTV